MTATASLVSFAIARAGLFFLVGAAVWTLSACGGGAAAIRSHAISGIGRIEVRKAEDRGEGVVIGVTQGGLQPEAAKLAMALSDRTGAGLAIAYGFRSRRIPVAQPLVHVSPVMPRLDDGGRPASVYPKFRRLVESATEGPLRFYIGVRIAAPESHPGRIEVATAGLTIEQIEALKAAFIGIQSRVAADRGFFPQVEIALNPVDEISWNATGVKDHGVLLAAEKGMILRLPPEIAPHQPSYRTILAEWVTGAATLVMRNPLRLREIEVQLVPYGRLESIASRKNLSGIVIGAPHGSFDRHTAEFAQQLGHRTSIAVVVAKGFSPTEAGGWRINVNRPTEKLYPQTGPEEERATERAREAYERFRSSVFEASNGPLDLYIDLHQNSADDFIDVATLGVTFQQAAWIKKTYREIRDRRLRGRARLPRVAMAIEPVDEISFRARMAKKHGVLRLAKRSLHFELPAHRVFQSTATRRAYAEILGEVIENLVARFEISRTAASPRAIAERLAP